MLGNFLDQIKRKRNESEERKQDILRNLPDPKAVLLGELLRKDDPKTCD